MSCKRHCHFTPPARSYVINDVFHLLLLLLLMMMMMTCSADNRSLPITQPGYQRL